MLSFGSHSWWSAVAGEFRLWIQRRDEWHVVQILVDRPNGGLGGRVIFTIHGAIRDVRFSRRFSPSPAAHTIYGIWFFVGVPEGVENAQPKKSLAVAMLKFIRSKKETYANNQKSNQLTRRRLLNNNNNNDNDNNKTTIYKAQ